MASNRESPLSDRLARLAEAAEKVAWPDRVTSAMAKLKDVTERVTGFMQQVSGDASSLGELAVEIGDGALADDAAEQLAQRVLREIDAYTMPEPRPQPLGEAPPSKWLAGRLSEMRAALVKPYVLDVADVRALGAAVRRPVLIVACDADRALLAFDPGPQGDFAVVWRRPNGDVLSNIRGGAVDCFLAT